MTIELNTKNTTAAEELATTLEELDRRQEEYEAAALAGTLSPSKVARIEGERRFAKMRADAANRAADTERSNLATGTKLRTTVEEFHQDPALSVDPIITVLEQLNAAAVELRRVITGRNSAVSDWVRKLNALGIPASGLTIDGNPVLLRADRITIGGSTVTTSNVEPHLSVAATIKVGEMEQLLERLRKDDRRGASAERVAKIRYVKPVGGRKVGDVVTTLNTTPSAAAHQVAAGYAELIEGELPEAREIPQRQVFYGAANIAIAIDESN